MATAKRMRSGWADSEWVASRWRTDCKRERVPGRASSAAGVGVRNVDESTEVDENDEDDEEDDDDDAEDVEDVLDERI